MTTEFEHLPPLPAVVFLHSGQTVARTDRDNEPSKGDTVILEDAAGQFTAFRCVGRERFYSDNRTADGNGLALGDLAIELEPDGQLLSTIPRHRVQMDCDGQPVGWTVGTTEPALGDLVSAESLHLAGRRRWRCTGVTRWYVFVALHGDQHTSILDLGHTVCHLTAIRPD